MAECGQMTPSLLEMVASTLMTDGDGDTYFNTIPYTGTDLASAIACGDNISDLEAYIVANGFGVDANGKPAIKIGHTT